MIIKTKKEVEKIRIAGKLASEVLDMITPFVVSGANTLELNDICHDFMLTKQDSIPATLGYRGFPKSIPPHEKPLCIHDINSTAHMDIVQHVSWLKNGLYKRQTLIGGV